MFKNAFLGGPTCVLSGQTGATMCSFLPGFYVCMQGAIYFIFSQVSKETNFWSDYFGSSNSRLSARDILIPGQGLAQCIKVISWLYTVATHVCKL